jgi:cbb3-type cytochrome oxidase maturation protein
MEVIYSLIPGMLLVGLAALAVLFWAARGGQFDDLDGDGQRILMDEERRKDRRRFPDADEEPDSTAHETTERSAENGRPPRAEDPTKS